MKKNILLVDDKIQILALLEHLLGDYYNVIVKGNGMEAMLWLQEGNIPDLILSDIQMPEMDGIELIRQIRHSGLFRDIPIIILSSRESSGDRVQCLKEGASDYISKPFNPEELIVRIEKVLA